MKTNIVQTQLQGKRFCIAPHVRGLDGGAVFRLVTAEGAGNYLLLEVEKINIKLGSHLIEEYRPAGPPDPEANFDGTLHLRDQCGVQRWGEDLLIEPEQKK